MEKAIDPAILSRYEWVSVSATPGAGGRERTGEVLIREIAPPVDDEHDTRFEFLRNGTTSSSFSLIGTAIQEAAERYARANGGLLPREAGDLTGYLERPVEAERVRRFLEQIPPGVTTFAEMRRREN